MGILKYLPITLNRRKYITTQHTALALPCTKPIFGGQRSINPHAQVLSNLCSISKPETQDNETKFELL